MNGTSTSTSTGAVCRTECRQRPRPCWCFRCPYEVVKVVVSFAMTMELKTTRRESSIASLGCAAVSAAFSIAALASPPLSTDDASTLDPGNCQFEIERRRFNRLTELDIVPACNLFGDMELAIGKLRATGDGVPPIDGTFYSIKKVLVAGGDGEWGVGFNAATIRAAGKASGTRQNQVTAVFSHPVEANGETMLHLNFGWVGDHEADRDARRNRFAWAIAMERDLSVRWTVVAEAFGQQTLPEAAQVGLRWWAVPAHVQFTTSVGALRGMGRDGRWVSLGVRFETVGAIYPGR